MKKDIRVALAVKFPEQSTQLMREMDALEDIAKLKQVLSEIPIMETAEQLRKLWG